MKVRGVVDSYDSREGLGWIVADGVRHLFHCAELLDGSREVDAGTQVTFVAVTRFGLLEASQIEKH